MAKGESLPETIPNPALVANHAAALTVLSKLNSTFNPSSKTLGLCPGAEYGEAKRWPTEYYAQVANHALKNGWQVMLFGSDKDVPVTQQINQITQNRCIDLGGKTKLGEAIDVMSLCDTVVSNDSGLMHVAAALIKENEAHKKLIAIFGSSDPYHTPPMSNQAVIEYLKLDCSPCFKRECPLVKPDQQLACLKKISPQHVILQMSAQ